MKNTIRIFMLVLLLVMLGHPPVRAQSGGSYTLTWSTLDGGGGMASASGAYALDGTIGQPDASNTLSGGNYGLTGGFWVEAARVFALYLPLIMRSAP